MSKKEESVIDDRFVRSLYLRQGYRPGRLARLRPGRWLIWSVIVLTALSVALTLTRH